MQIIDEFVWPGGLVHIPTSVNFSSDEMRVYVVYFGRVSRIKKKKKKKWVSMWLKRTCSEGD